MISRKGRWIGDGDPAPLGVTKEFIEDSGDVTYVSFKKNVGDEFEKGDVLFTLETVKSAVDVEAPVSGKVIEINSELENDPDPINESPEETWMMKIEIKE